MNLSACVRIEKPSASHSLPQGFLPEIPSNDQGFPSDDVLVARSRAGDEVAFEELMARHRDKLFRLAMHFVRNKSDADEVLQEVLLSAWRKLPGFEGRAQISSWLHRVTVNAALMFLRARARRPLIMVGDNGVADPTCPTEFEGHAPSLDPTSRPDEQLQSAELQRQIQNAVDRLPAGLRTVFFAREVEGYSTQQAALSLGLSPPAVKTRLHRARAALRENMQEYLAP